MSVKSQHILLKPVVSNELRNDRPTVSVYLSCGDKLVLRITNRSTVEWDELDDAVSNGVTRFTRKNFSSHLPLSSSPPWLLGSLLFAVRANRK